MWALELTQIAEVKDRTGEASATFFNPFAKLPKGKKAKTAHTRLTKLDKNSEIMLTCVCRRRVSLPK